MENKNYTNVMTLLSMHVSEDGTVEDEKQFLEVIKNHKEDFQSAMYFKDVAKDPFEPEKILAYIKETVIPELSRIRHK